MVESPWFSKAFGAFYTDVYAHRNEAEAQAHLPSILKLAKLSEGQYNILDLGCGQGRYTHLINQHGHHIVGLDYSSELLHLAHSDYPQLSLCRGNMLQLPFVNHFDRVLSLFTSFGYFENDHDNFTVLQQMSDCLKNKGLLYLDFLNANLVQPSDWEEKQLGRFLQISKKEILPNLNLVQKTIKLYHENDLKYQYHEKVKLYDLDWFILKTQSLQLHLKQTFGDYQANPYDPNSSPRLILVFEKNS
jgi:ubiquinone/menaquinone biosynthesis C-methylase UbiE